MSVVGCVKVYDGVVLGADSATQIQVTDAHGQVQFVKSYENAQKLFRIGNLQICALTYGLGNIGNRSILSVITEFNKQFLTNLNDHMPVEAVANELLNFVKGFYNANFPHPANRPVLGFFIAGFSANDTLAQEWEFMLPDDLVCRQVRDINTFGIDWRGMGNPFMRLYKGYDPGLIAELISTFNLDANLVLPILNNYESKVAYNGMPLQDAIEFLTYVLESTINYSQFEIGVPACSKPIDMIMITPIEYRELSMKLPSFS